MDCNSYSYAPHMLDDMQRKTPVTPCDRVTIERRHANGRDYFIVLDNTNGGSNKAYDIDSAARIAIDWIRNGV